MKILLIIDMQENMFKAANPEEVKNVTKEILDIIRKNKYDFFAVILGQKNNTTNPIKRWLSCFPKEAVMIKDIELAVKTTNHKIFYKNINSVKSSKQFMAMLNNLKKSNGLSEIGIVGGYAGDCVYASANDLNFLFS